MSTTSLSSKGQIVLPAALRRARLWSAGMRFELVEQPDGVLLKPLSPAVPFAPTTLDGVVGIARYTGPPRSVAEMNAAVAALAAAVPRGRS